MMRVAGWRARVSKHNLPLSRRCHAIMIVRMLLPFASLLLAPLPLTLSGLGSGCSSDSLLGGLFSLLLVVMSIRVGSRIVLLRNGIGVHSFVSAVLLTLVGMHMLEWMLSILFEVVFPRDVLVLCLNLRLITRLIRRSSGSSSHSRNGSLSGRIPLHPACDRRRRRSK